MKNDWHKYDKKIEFFKQKLEKSSIIEENKKFLLDFCDLVMNLYFELV